MEEYVCVYFTGPLSTARGVYHADDLAQAMAMHNAALPERADQVLKWIGPTGITFHMHDSKLTLESE